MKNKRDWKKEIMMNLNDYLNMNNNKKNFFFIKTLSLFYYALYIELCKYYYYYYYYYLLIKISKPKVSIISLHIKIFHSVLYP